jgi:hypothetical protein
LSSCIIPSSTPKRYHTAPLLSTPRRQCPVVIVAQKGQETAGKKKNPAKENLWQEG